MFKDFIIWVAGAMGKGLFCGAALCYGVPPICDFLIKQIAEEMEREHIRTKLRAEHSYRYLMGETSVSSVEKYGR